MQLVIQNLSKTYGNGVKALDNVSLTIPSGMFGLLGPNGAGKSTLMRILATLQEADSGSAMLGEIDVLKNKEAVRRVLGYLPQEFGVYPKVSAYQMLDHIALLKGVIDNGERKALVEALLQKVNLWEHRKRRIAGFSGGMKQRFGIAQSLIGEPKLIIVDEPTAGLDPGERNRFYNLLTEIGENVVVILSTHIVQDVRELCSNMAIINRGRIIAEDTPENLGGREDQPARISFRITAATDPHVFDSFAGLEISAPDGSGHREAVMETTSPVGDVNALTGAAIAAKAELIGLEVRRPTLEDVYLEMTDA